MNKLFSREDNSPKNRMILWFSRGESCMKYIGPYCHCQSIQRFGPSLRDELIKTLRWTSLNKKNKELKSVIPLSSCLFRFSLGTKVPSAFAIISDLVFAYCILWINGNIKLSFSKRTSSIAWHKLREKCSIYEAAAAESKETK